MMLMETSAGNIIVVAISGLLVLYLLYNFIRARKSMNRPPSEHVIILNDKNFDITVKNGVSLVDFWAAWCGPCKIQGPIVDEVADEMNGKANICKLDVDQNQQIARKFGIQSIPTLVIFKDGKPVKKMVGLNSKAALLKSLQSQL